MSALLQVRNVPDETRKALKARAAARGMSLNSYLLEVVEREVQRPTVDEVLARAAQRSGRASASAVQAVDEARRSRTSRTSRSS